MDGNKKLRYVAFSIGSILVLLLLCLEMTHVRNYSVFTLNISRTIVFDFWCDLSLDSGAKWALAKKAGYVFWFVTLSAGLATSWYFRKETSILLNKIHQSV
ncbi:hypothetical protein [Planctobacterium marinum]